MGCRNQSAQVELDVQPSESESIPTNEASSDSEGTVAIESLSPPEVVVSSNLTAVPEAEAEPVSEPTAAIDLEETAVPDTSANDLFDSVTKIVRYSYEGQEAHGVVSEDGLIQRLEGDLFAEYRLTDEIVPLDQVKILAPIVPSKIIAVGLNYRSHAGEFAPDAPGLFAKFPSSLAGPDDPIWLFPESDNTHYEGELVVVIGKTAHNVSVEEAPNYIFGVTAGNDITERTWQTSDLQWVRAKASDSFAPIGPFIVTGLDYNDLLVQTRLNGETTQSESTANLIHSVDAIVSYTSRYITLEPGDIIYTGTPGSTQAMVAGDVVEVEVEGVGILRNTAQNWNPDS
ncbi:MAG: fumarylacetoacetate hydrolase family protein [Anaerolineae bacterium]|nr:fumarylacetoacetate hydrolase family protein [Anaerolineae bacterium]